MDKKAPVLWGDVQTLFLQMFPVGSFIINNTGVNPSTYLGGTWQKVADNTFLVTGSGNSKDNKITLTAQNLPTHTIASNNTLTGYLRSCLQDGSATTAANAVFTGSDGTHVKLSDKKGWSYDDTGGWSGPQFYARADFDFKHNHTFTNNSQSAIDISSVAKRTTMYVWYRTA